MKAKSVELGSQIDDSGEAHLRAVEVELDDLTAAHSQSAQIIDVPVGAPDADADSTRVG